MFGGILALLAVALVAVGVMVATLPRRRRRIAEDEARHPALRPYRVATGAWRSLGAVGGVIVAWVAVLSQSAWNGRGLGVVFAPIILGLALVVAVLVGDMAARGGLRSRDRAVAVHGERTVAPRRPGLVGLLPLPLMGAVVGMTAILFALFCVAWATGSDDDRGSHGRVLHAAAANGMAGTSVGPWPGRYFGIWGMPATLVLIAVVTVAIIGVWLRRHVTTDLVAADDIARRSEVEALVAAGGLAISLLTAGVGATMASTLITVRENSRLGGWDVGLGYDVAAWLCIVLSLAAVALTVLCAISLLVPGYGAPRRAETTSTAPLETVAA